MLTCFLCALLLGVSGTTEQSVNFPLFKWAQDKSRIWITVHVKKASDLNVEFRDQGLLLTCIGSDTKFYKLDLDFLHPIDTQQSRTHQFDTKIRLVVVKRNAGPHWPHLLSTSKKLEEGNMRIDWTRWTVEEDESTNEQPLPGKPKVEQPPKVDETPTDKSTTTPHSTQDLAWLQKSIRRQWFRFSKFNRGYYNAPLVGIAAIVLVCLYGVIMACTATTTPQRPRRAQTKAE
eukprot:c14434_g1_i1.p1 GENE.c14434_g1_i1~~c14434_g1_i1.p1  ORF type:complete len:232 (-),score=38.03 c14434_g1_i1:73-768(-)